MGWRRRSILVSVLAVPLGAARWAVAFAADAGSGGAVPGAVAPPTPLAAPTLSLLTAPDAAVPELSLRIPADWQVPVSERWQVSTALDFSTTTLDQTVAHDQAVYNAQDLAVPGLAAALAAGVRYVRCGLSSGGGAPTWSNTVMVGSAAAPAFISSQSFRGTEGAPIAAPIALSGPVAELYVAGGEMGRNYRISGFSPGDSSAVLEYVPGYVGDFDPPSAPVHEIIVAARGLNGVYSYAVVTNSLTDVDEVADAVTLAPVTNAATSTMQRVSHTVAGLAAGVSVPFTWTGTDCFKNGAGTSALSGTVQNCDVLDLGLMSASGYQATVSAVLSLTGSTVVTGTFNVSTMLDPAGVQPVLPTSGVPAISTSGASSRTYSGITFDQGGVLLVAVHCLVGTPTGMTLNGVAMTEIAASGAGTDKVTKLFRAASAVAAGTHSIGVTGTGMTSLGISPVMMPGAAAAVSDTSIRATGAGTVPHAFADTLVVPANGLGLIAMTGGGTPTSWNNGAVQIIAQTASSLGMALAVTGAGTATPAFVHAATFSNTSGAAASFAHA